MSLTAFGMIFVPICLLCAWRPERLLQLILLGATFDAAAVFIVGDYGIGPPLLAASFFMAFALLQELLGFEFVGRHDAWAVVAPFAIFTLWALIGSFVLPRLFNGQVEVWPQKAQIILGRVPLAPGPSNLTQDFYLVFAGLMLWLSALFFAQPRLNPRPFVNAYLLSGFLSATLAFWQLASKLAGIPYPETFLRSNPGWALLQESLGRVPRISGTFTEPAALANYMAGIVGATGWMILKGHPGRTIRILLLAALCTMAISTSTTGFGLIALMAVGLPVYALLKGSSRLLSRVAGVGILLIAIGGISVFGLLTFEPGVGRGFMEVYDSTIHKQESTSYDLRSDADLNSLALFVSTYGLGVGWGSNRSSSLLPGTLASVGVVGTLCAIWFGAGVARQVNRARAVARRPGDCAALDAATGATVASLAGALLSGPSFDAVNSFLLIGLLVGTSVRVLRESRITQVAPRANAGAMQQASADF